MTPHAASPLLPLHCPRSCCRRPGWGAGCTGLGFLVSGALGGVGPLPWGRSESSLHVRNMVRKKGREVGKSHGQGPGSRPTVGRGAAVGVCPGRPRAMSLWVSSAAQRHEAVHEGLPRPQPGRQLRLGGHWRCAASRGQPGPPPVQPHWLEEEKTRAHEGQPARQPQQVMLRRLPPASQTAGVAAGPGPETRPGRPRCMPRVWSRPREQLAVSSVKP